jgi:hypothetical protein
LERHVVRKLRVDHGRLARQGQLGIHDGRQHLVGNDNGVGGVARGVAIAGDDHGDGLAHVPDDVDRHSPMFGRGERRADRHRREQPGEAGPGVDGLHAWHRLGGAGVD